MTFYSDGGTIFWEDFGQQDTIYVTQGGNYDYVVDFQCYEIQGTYPVSLSVEENPGVLANVITVGKDNINEYFSPFGLCDQNKICTIYNRWGNKVFEFESGSLGWDGRAPNGNVVEEGVYHYVIQEEGQKSISGYITVEVSD